MAKPSRRPGREEAKALRRERKKAQKELRLRQQEEGLTPTPTATLPNRTSLWESEEEEQAERQASVEEHHQVLRALLPALLKRLSRIRDPRRPGSVRHKLTIVLVYGVLLFVYQMASRREANQVMTRPTFVANLQALFPELESLPHGDTLQRLLERIDVEEIEKAQVTLVKRLIRQKKFQRYLVEGRYRIAIDGTQKFSRDWFFADEASQRTIDEGDDAKTTYYVYALEANLILEKGVSIPLMTEFLQYPDGDAHTKKQDCELKAFHRLAKRLKRMFPRVPVTLLLDGLYPNGPVMELCRRYGWDFMIVLQDDSLPSVWKEAHHLNRLQSREKANEHELCRNWGGRRQHFWWANHIEHEYAGRRKRQPVHVVVCEESWEEIPPGQTKPVTKTSRHAWISCRPLDAKNVHTRCNLVGRCRWTIENHILVEKRQGYQYEHVFSYEWKATKGYHYLMRIGHLVNTLAQISIRLVDRFATMGIRRFLRFLRETMAATRLDRGRLRERAEKQPQLRLV